MRKLADKDFDENVLKTLYDSQRELHRLVDSRSGEVDDTAQLIVSRSGKEDVANELAIEDMEALFASLDTSGDGFLSQDELSDFLCSFFVAETDQLDTTALFKLMNVQSDEKRISDKTDQVDKAEFKDIEDLRIARSKISEIFNKRICDLEAKALADAPTETITVSVVSGSGVAIDFEGFNAEDQLALLVEKVKKHFNISKVELKMAKPPMKHPYTEADYGKSLSNHSIASGCIFNMSLPPSPSASAPTTSNAPKDGRAAFCPLVWVKVPGRLRETNVLIDCFWSGHG
jgi:hypothetical protein